MSEELNKEELQDTELSEIESLYFIPMNTDNLSEIKYDKKEFQKGVNIMSFDCGKITALINCGVSAQDAVSWILNEQTLEYNREQQILVNENNVTLAKIQSAKAESVTL